MTPETSNLIIGALLGAGLTFITSQLERRCDFKKRKKVAIMCLKIEIGRLNKFFESDSNATDKLGNKILPLNNIPNLDLSVRADQFMYYDERLSALVFQIAKSIDEANQCLEITQKMFDNQQHNNFQMNAMAFVSLKDDAKRLTKEIIKFLPDKNSTCSFEMPCKKRK